MNKIVISCFYTILLLILGCATNNITTKGSYAVLLGIDPEDAAILTNYKIVVIDAQYFTKDEITAVQAKGTAVYTYLNIGSIETFRDGYDDLKRFSLAPYENWPDEYWMDASRAEWQTFLAKEAASLNEKGVDGFFLDNADVYYLYPTDAIYNGLIAILGHLAPFGKPVLINGGDVFVTKAVLDADSPVATITGVNQECVFTNINFTSGTLTRQDAENLQYYQDYLARCKNVGLTVCLLEYAKSNDPVSNDISDYCHKNGFQYYISPSIYLD